MATAKKISELTTATPLNGTELAVVVQNGETRQSNVSAFTAPFSDRLAAVSTQVSLLTVRITAVSTSVAENQSSIVSVNAVVSALDVRLAAASLVGTQNTESITSINEVVSLKAFRTGDYLDAVQYIEFDTSTLIPTSVGRLSWNLDDGTLNLGLIGGNVVNQLGQELVQRCYNNTGVTITEGSVVKVVGATGQRLTIELAQANNDANSLTVIGVATENIANKALGYVATEGFVRGINTHGFTDGEVLWLSPVSAGKFTNVKPVAPQHLVMVGYVVKGGSVGAGSIFVKVQNGYELGELHDVKVSAATSIQDGEILAYNVSASVWTNSTRLLDIEASVSALNVLVAALDVSAVNARLETVSAAVSSLTLEVAAVSALTSVNSAAITSINAVVSALDVRIANVSALTSVNAAAVSALDVRLTAVSASVSALNVLVNAIDVSAINARIDAVSAATSVNAAAITSVNAVVSGLDVRLAVVSASVSALSVQLGVVSAAVSVNAASITSVNAVVSALDVRIETVSVAVSALTVRVDAISASLANMTATYMTVAEVSLTTSAVPFYRYIADTSATPFTIFLPTAPSIGDVIGIVDKSGTFAAKNLLISRAGNTIEGLPEDLVCDLSRATFELLFSGTDWRIV